MAGLRLRHLHFPSWPTEGRYPAYKTAAAVQELLRRRLLDYKDVTSSTRHTSPPHPTLISFTPPPTYTLGRRQAQASPASSSAASSSLRPAEIARLKAPLHVRSLKADPLPALGVVPTNRNSQSTDATTPGLDDHHVFHPSVFASPRGGLATYHGPGQVVLWPVMIINDSSAPLGYKHFTVRCYSRLLENTTIALLQRLFGLKGFTTEDPGVWVHTPAGHRLQQQQPTGPIPPSPAAAAAAAAAAHHQHELPASGGEFRKISALGIHLRRHVSSLGAAINLDMPTTNAAVARSHDSATTAADADFNPWTRFVACGLEGKGVTCVQQELLAAGGTGIPGLDPDIVARVWAEELAERMELDPKGIETVGPDETDQLVWSAEKEGYLDAVAKDEL